MTLELTFVVPHQESTAWKARCGFSCRCVDQETTTGSIGVRCQHDLVIVGKCFSAKKFGLVTAEISSEQLGFKREKWMIRLPLQLKPKNVQGSDCRRIIFARQGSRITNITMSEVSRDGMERTLVLGGTLRVQQDLSSNRHRCLTSVRERLSLENAGFDVLPSNCDKALVLASGPLI